MYSQIIPFHIEIRHDPEDMPSHTLQSMPHFKMNGYDSKGDTKKRILWIYRQGEKFI